VLADQRIIVPGTVFLISLIIYGAFGSAKWACLNLVNVAVARVGGLLALYITGTHFSVSSGVGFLALFGASVQTGLIMVEYINQLRVRGYSIETAAIEGAVRRLRPIMMTMLVATLGLLPAALSHAIGSDSQRPFAITIVGGLIVDLIMSIFLLRLVGPTYRSFAVARVGASGAGDALVVTGRAVEFMISLMACPSCCRAESIALASRVQCVQSGPTERAICIARSAFPRFFRIWMYS
jgi:Cu/Ag efflux pump CusA